MEKKRAASGLLLIPAILFMIVAVMPLFRGGSLNVVFFSVAIVWFIIGVAVMKKQQIDTGRSASAPDGRSDGGGETLP